MDEPFKEIGEANNGKNKTVKTMKVKIYMKLNLIEIQKWKP